jgi:microcystin-dependent protein
MKKNYLLTLIVVTLLSLQNTNAQDGYFGEIRMFAGNYAPVGWAFCDGQLMSIAQNNALFAILGTNYGGDGKTTFALPDLRGRVPVHAGSSAGPGLSYIPLGERAGTPTTSILVSNLPAHSHNIYATTTAATSNHPTSAILADTSTLDNEYAPYSTANVIMAPTAFTGNNLPINNMQPYIGINYIICISGFWPTRP